MTPVVFLCPGECLGRLELVTASSSEAWYIAESLGWQITGPVATCRRCTEAAS